MKRVNVRAEVARFAECWNNLLAPFTVPNPRRAPTPSADRASVTVWAECPLSGRTHQQRMGSVLLCLGESFEIEGRPTGYSAEGRWVLEGPPDAVVFEYSSTDPKYCRGFPGGVRSGDLATTSSGVGGCVAGTHAWKVVRMKRGSVA